MYSCNDQLLIFHGVQRDQVLYMHHFAVDCKGPSQGPGNKGHGQCGGKCGCTHAHAHTRTCTHIHTHLMYKYRSIYVLSLVQHLLEKLVGARRIMVVGNGGIAMEIV